MQHGQPLLDHCPQGLPRAAYLASDRYAREMGPVFARGWTCASRLKDLARGRMKRVKVGAAKVILCRSADGWLSAFHNACCHRGSDLCRGEEQPRASLAEMNQRGLRSPACTRGRLMPEEFEIHRFHNWLRTEMEETP